MMERTICTQDPVSITATLIMGSYQGSVVEHISGNDRGLALFMSRRIATLLQAR